MPHHATPEGTAGYRERFAAVAAADHFRPAQGLLLSSVGIGTYLGDPDPATDAAYGSALAAALEGGCNVVDTAINYRFQRSERAIGESLATMFASGAAGREQIVVATKGGYVPFDGGFPDDPGRWFHDTFVRPGIASVQDLVAGSHCMTPAYLRHQLATSLENLRLQTIDVYYVHNPETQLGEVGREEFLRRIGAAFETLEEAASSGQIRWYGVATWNAFRQQPSERDYVALADLEELARRAGGSEHRFRFVQLPCNLAMPEAVARTNQIVAGDRLSTLEAARRLDISVMASASMLQGRLARQLPEELREALGGLRTDAQRAIQFARSAPGVATALVGMKRQEHVRENLELARVPALNERTFRERFAWS